MSEMASVSAGKEGIVLTGQLVRPDGCGQDMRTGSENK
ncbi:MAG: hypothetical protein OP8BY_1323 [Candidatus Saccharicenans subterraneus]|uniref:Uncharacterized protein n=1 Tax=Candidatus Saccharicenans subterraneus TaxID=2508984 RepID=A0A3E2BPL8_9BACT|nr:MAG: hypothetical protein OP8BY_1323 [Candidatus Saccharicenans subterraneum]